MNPTKTLPLFIITGASCVGKSTICEILFQNEKEYIVMESDLLWNNIYNFPDDDYREYRELWMRVCKNISQIGLPVVLCGCATPKQFKLCYERKNFSEIYYLAMICDTDILEKRMRDKRGITDENWIKSSLEFNSWLKENADKTSPAIQLLDISKLNAPEAAELVNKWILENISKERIKWEIC